MVLLTETTVVTCHTGKVTIANDEDLVLKRLKIAKVPGSPEALLPGYGEAYDTCGTVRHRVNCVPSEEGGHLKFHLNHCDRKDCPICYTKWVHRRARKASERIWWIYNQQPKRVSGNPRNLRHVTITAPSHMWGLPFRELQQWGLKQMKKILRSGGGLYVGHPWRFQDVNGNPVPWKHSDLNQQAESPIIDSYAVYGPHLHFIIWGWLIDVDECFERFKFRYKYLSATPSELEVYYCVRYLLTHTAVLDRSHVVRYFGQASYNRVEVVQEWKELIRATCPDCGKDMYYETETGEWDAWDILITRRMYRFKVDQKKLVRVPRVKMVKGTNLDMKHSMAVDPKGWVGNIYTPPS